MATCKPRCSSWPLLILTLIILATPAITSNKVQHKVRCTEDSMIIEVIKPDLNSLVYLDSLKDYPDPACRPRGDDGRLITFELNLSEVFRCGLTRVHNSLTGLSVYYHRVVVEQALGDGSGRKQLLSAKCVVQNNSTRTRRNVLPAGFQEPEELEITKTLTIMAPEPVLRVAVRQAGRLVSGELNVSPGTALQMELGLDQASAPVYGLLVSHMQVSDTRTQEETIIFNGCSVDPYLFENFNTVDGDFLTAKFRAFKFPESTYVQFKGTVNVCLDKCRGVECSNGRTGYGRRRRAVSELPPDPNKVFEITMSTFLKVEYEGESLLEKGRLSAILEPFMNQTEEVNQKLEVQENIQEKAVIKKDLRDEERYTLLLTASTVSSSSTVQLPIFAIIAITLRLLLTN